MRIRICNEESGRCKDLLVDNTRLEDMNLFDDVYNAKSVKEAHVRKWKSPTAERIKNNTWEILCSVYHSADEAPSHQLTVDQLESTNLYHILPPQHRNNQEHFVKLVLQCVKKSQRCKQQHEHRKLETRQLNGQGREEGNNESSLPQHLNPVNYVTIRTNGPSSPSGSSPLPDFTAAGVHSSNQSRVRTKHSSSSDEAEAEEDEGQLKPPSFSSPSNDVAADISLKSAIISSKSKPSIPISQEQGRQLCHSTTTVDVIDVDRLPSNSNDFFPSEWRADSETSHGKLSRVRTRRGSLQLSGDRDSSTKSLDSFSIDASSLQDSSDALGAFMLKATSLRIRVINMQSKRSKDLVVDTEGAAERNLYDSIYNHRGVRLAHVRKWGPQQAADVRKGNAEIQALVWDDGTGKPWHVYSIKDLKQTTLSQLRQVVPESTDLIKILLQCVKVEKALTATRSKSLQSTDDESRSIESGVQGRLEGSRSESFLKSCFHRKPTRPNHMNLSSMKGSDYGETSGATSRSASLALLKLELSLTDNVPVTITEPTSQKPKSNPSSRRASIASSNELGLNEKADRLEEHPEYQSNDTLSKMRKPSSLTPVGFHNEDYPFQVEQKKTNSLLCSLQQPQSKISLQEDSYINDGSSLAADEGEVVTSSQLHRLPNTVEAGGRNTASTLLPRLSSITLNVDNIFSSPHLATSGAQNAKFNQMPRSAGTEIDSNQGSIHSAGHLFQSSDPKISNRINRFLHLSQSSVTGFVSGTSRASPQQPIGDNPPIKEIEVVQSDKLSAHSSSAQGIPLSPDIVMEVFPYHVIFDASFKILQVGNSLSLLIDDEMLLLGRAVSDILMVTGPIPMFGKWDWTILEKMKEKTIYLESVFSNACNRKAKIKGTLIEVAKSPRQVMLVLYPNAKNLSELKSMNLSLVDLPLYSCQREAVLLGEHSKSEVKLTNHLDKVHRDLLDSMEKQIEDRTNELATANQDLARANEQLAGQSARQLEHFACMSHEIRTPLNCIVGMSSLLLEDSLSMDPMHAESIRMINTSGELLKAVVDDVLDYAKLESGSFEVDIKPTSLQFTLDSVAHSISQKLQEKNIRLRTFYSPTLPDTMETDSRRLQQVLFNLLGNSAKFSKPSSVIDLTVSLISAAERKSTGKMMGGEQDSKSDDVIRFSVKDYGKGIDKKDFKTIFEPFSQASKESQTVYGGTGLGLSITSKLVHRLGGTISLDSEMGKFAEFTVDLPFRGVPVDVNNLRSKLKDTTIIIVEPKLEFDLSFAENAIKSDALALDQEVANIYHLDVLRLERMDQVYSTLNIFKERRTQRNFAIVVHENLFEERAVERLESMAGQLDYTLMTYGPNYAIKVTKGQHFKGLLGLFPAVLLESITKHIAQQKIRRLSLASKPAVSKSPTKNYPPGSVDPLGQINPVNLLDEKQGGRKIFKEMMPSTRTPKSHPTVNIKVLIAEDNVINQKVLTKVLNRAGVKDITVVDDGLKAVNVSGRVTFDCIFMDMQMPVMDGIEACRLIVRRDGKKAKVVFVTAHALDEFKHQAVAAGGTSFITKPFRIQDIENLLKSL